MFSSPKMLYQAQIVPPFFPAVNPGKINKNTWKKGVFLVKLWFKKAFPAGGASRSELNLT